MDYEYEEVICVFRERQCLRRIDIIVIDRLEMNTTVDARLCSKFWKRWIRRKMCTSKSATFIYQQLLSEIRIAGVRYKCHWASHWREIHTE